MTEPEINEILQAVSALDSLYAVERRSPQFITAVGLLLAGSTLQKAAGCRWLHFITDQTDERLNAYRAREDVKMGNLQANHIAQCPECQNPHQVGAFLVGLGVQVDTVFTRMVEEAARALK